MNEHDYTLCFLVFLKSNVKKIWAYLFLIAFIIYGCNSRNFQFIGKNTVLNGKYVIKFYVKFG